MMYPFPASGEREGEGTLLGTDCPHPPALQTQRGPLPLPETGEG